MEEFSLTLNNFLFNSGILGFYRIMEHVNKENLINISGNILKVKKEALEHFEDDYIRTMLNTFVEQTRWYSIVSNKNYINNIDMNTNKEQLENQYKFVKKAIDSASYKSGYESIKNVSEVNPYELLQQYKDSDNDKKKEILIKIIEHLEKYKEVYCMKDIIYTKINCFWEGKAFLNRSANKNDIKEEYRKTFVEPAIKYLSNIKKSEYKCIECGNSISKSEADGMSWLCDVGVDMNRKKSGFWNFNEDALLCPICSLIYSCIPLGFYIIGSNGIFVNNNESLEELKMDNVKYDKDALVEQTSLESAYNRIVQRYVNKVTNMEYNRRLEHEPSNIQVVTRVGDKDNKHYVFNVISKDKLEVIKNTSKDFDILSKSNVYQEVLNNLLYGIKQYNLIGRLLRQDKDIKIVGNILNIELASMRGGKKMEEEVKDMVEAGESLRKKMYASGENLNKLRSYYYKLQGALKANNPIKFMQIFTMFYGSMGKPMPNSKAIIELMSNSEKFRLLGYAYVYGLGKLADKKGENENEE